MRVDTPPIVRTFYDQHEKELLHILKNVQTSGLVNVYHPLDIVLLCRSSSEILLMATEHNLKAVELDLRNTMSKEWKCALVKRLKEQPCIDREWDELRAFMIPGVDLNVGPQTAEDIEKERGMPGGFQESSSKGKALEPVTPQRGEGSQRHQRFQQQTEDGDSVQKEAEYRADERGSDHTEDESTRTTSTPTGPPGDSSSEESNCESDRPRSPPPTTKPRKATRKDFEREKSTEEQESESLTAVIASRRTTKKSKALTSLKLEPSETLYGDENKWKNSQSFDG